MPVDKADPGASSLPRTLAKVVEDETCAGCGLCAGISGGAIEMHLDAAGFARPRAIGDATKTPDDVYARTCPGAVVHPWQTDDRETHPAWGPYRDVLTGNATDEDVRYQGSSGGMLSALAIHALETGLVDGVLHIRADADRPLLNAATLSTDKAQVLAAAGSRYGPSPMLEDIGRLLDRSNERFLIIGKPCDISAMRQLATIDRRVDERFPFMLSFFCGGMPSIEGTHAILDEMDMDPGDVSAFRYRGEGWPGTAKAVATDGRTERMSYEQSWGSHLSSRVQYRCKICPDAVGGVADIACADAWFGGETGYPQFEEQDGRSLVMVRTHAGAELLRGALGQGAVETRPLPISDVDLMQPSQARRKRLVVARSLAGRVLMQLQPTMRGLHLVEAAKTAAIGEQFRNFLGSLRRILTGRR